MSEHIKCTYCETRVDHCPTCGTDNPLIAKLTAAQAKIAELEDQDVELLSRGCDGCKHYDDKMAECTDQGIECNYEREVRT